VFIETKISTIARGKAKKPCQRENGRVFCVWAALDRTYFSS
jgi:hypothetical protein